MSEVSQRRAFVAFAAPWRRLRWNAGALNIWIPAGFLAMCLLVAILAPLVAPFGFDEINVGGRLEAPSAAHVLGTDNFGRDILSRLVYGARYTFINGLSCVVISGVIGIVLGALGGYFPGWTRTVIMRVMDIILSFPGLILAMGISVAMGPGAVSAIVAVSIAGVPAFARVTYVMVVGIKEREYIEASRVSGSGHLPIILHHVLPNAMGPLLVQCAIEFRSAILFTSALSFIGLGAQPPASEWGLMVSDGRLYLLTGQWWLSFFPGIAISIVVLAMSILADGIRDHFDPRLSRSR